MAEKILKGINFPGLEDTYIIPEVDDTLSKLGSPADAKVVGDEISGLKELVGDSSVADQIAAAITDEVYVQTDEPTDAPNGALWIDLDEGPEDFFIDIEVDSSLTVEGAAADAKAVGDKLSSIENQINNQQIATDPTLTKENYAADAKATGEKITELSNRMFVSLTKAEYDILVSSGNINEDTPYLIIDGDSI